MAQQEAKIYNSEQEVFDDIVAYAKTMETKSADAIHNCFYRNRDGNRCLVGALITDVEYNNDMELKTVQGLLTAGLLPERLIHFMDLLTECQGVHDNCTQYFFKRNLLEGLSRVAEIRNLTFNLS